MAVATGNRHQTRFLSRTVSSQSMAAIGSSRDDLLDRLNELNVEGDGAVANRRAMPLQARGPLQDLQAGTSTIVAPTR